MSAFRDDPIASRVLNRHRSDIESRLRIDDEFCLLVDTLLQEQHLTANESELIHGEKTNLARVSELIDCLRRRMTTAVFVAFVDALGSSEVAMLPTLRAKLIEAYVADGGDATIFGIVSQVDGSVPSLSCKESQSMPPLLNCKEKVEVKIMPRLIRDLAVTSWDEWASVALLLDHNSFTRLNWGTTSRELVFDSKVKQFRDLPSKELAQKIVLLPSQTTTKLLLLWPHLLAQVYIQHSDDGSIEMKGHKELEGVMPGLSVLIEDNHLLLGFGNGRLRCVRVRPSGELDIGREEDLPGALKGMSRNPGGGGALLWTQEGHVISVQHRGGRLRTKQCWQTSRGVLRSCASHGSTLTALLDFPRDQLMLQSFQEGNRSPRLHLELGTSRGPVQVAIDTRQTAVIVTPSQLILVRDHKPCRRIRLPWSDLNPDRLSLEIFQRRHFLLTVTKSERLEFLAIDDGSYDQ